MVIWHVFLFSVAPYLGAWIEIMCKYGTFTTSADVAPYLGAWIEIESDFGRLTYCKVAPYLGAWIEICSSR